MQLAYRHDERPGKSYEALDGKKSWQLATWKGELWHGGWHYLRSACASGSRRWHLVRENIGFVTGLQAAGTGWNLKAFEPCGVLYQKRWVFFRCDVLPFGASAAVYSFNWVSLHHLICKLFWGLAHVFMMTLQSVPVHLRPFCQKQWELCSRFLDGITPRWV